MRTEIEVSRRRTPSTLDELAQLDLYGEFYRRGLLSRSLSSRLTAVRSLDSNRSVAPSLTIQLNAHYSVVRSQFTLSSRLIAPIEPS